MSPAAGPTPPLSVANGMCLARRPGAATVEGPHRRRAAPTAEDQDPCQRRIGRRAPCRQHPPRTVVGDAASEGDAELGVSRGRRPRRTTPSHEGGPPRRRLLREQVVEVDRDAISMPACTAGGVVTQVHPHSTCGEAAFALPLAAKPFRAMAAGPSRQSRSEWHESGLTTPILRSACSPEGTRRTASRFRVLGPCPLAARDAAIAALRAHPGQRPIPASAHGRCVGLTGIRADRLPSRWTKRPNLRTRYVSAGDFAALEGVPNGLPQEDCSVRAT